MTDTQTIMTDTQTNTIITGNLSMEDFYVNQPFEAVVCPFTKTKTIVLECDKFVVKDKILNVELTIPDISVFDSISINGIIYERKSK